MSGTADGSQLLLLLPSPLAPQAPQIESGVRLSRNETSTENHRGGRTLSAVDEPRSLPQASRDDLNGHSTGAGTRGERGFADLGEDVLATFLQSIAHARIDKEKEAAARVLQDSADAQLERERIARREMLDVLESTGSYELQAERDGHGTDPTRASGRARLHAGDGDSSSAMDTGVRRGPSASELPRDATTPLRRSPQLAHGVLPGGLRGAAHPCDDQPWCVWCRH